MVTVFIDKMVSCIVGAFSFNFEHSFGQERHYSLWSVVVEAAVAAMIE